MRNNRLFTLNSCHEIRFFRWWCFYSKSRLILKRTRPISFPLPYLFPDKCSNILWLDFKILSDDIVAFFFLWSLMVHFCSKRAFECTGALLARFRFFFFFFFQEEVVVSETWNLPKFKALFTLSARGSRPLPLKRPRFREEFRNENSNFIKPWHFPSNVGLYLCLSGCVSPKRNILTIIKSGRRPEKAAPPP